MASLRTAAVSPIDRSAGPQLRRSRLYRSQPI